VLPKLGIIAGQGDLPALVADAADSQGRDTFILALEGQTSQDLVEGRAHCWVRLGAVGGAIDALSGAGCEEVVFAGAVRRPSLFNLGLDARGAKLFAKVGKAALGDDRLLTVLVKELEGAGLNVVGADDVLTGLLVKPGVLGRHAPDEIAEIDIALGLDVAKAIGALDIGQAVVVQQGVVLGVEAVEGTDALIRRCAEIRREGPGGVLVKIKKPGQERRVDLPTIGPETVDGLVEAGLRGIVIEAGATLVLHRDAVIAAADAAGLFLMAAALEP
jgi:DUF1009 family protein